MIRSSRREEALIFTSDLWLLTADFCFFSLSLLTSSPTNGGQARFERHLPESMAALEQNSLVELDRQTVRVIG